MASARIRMALPDAFNIRQSLTHTGGLTPMQAESILQQHSSVYSIVTEQILKQLESGVAPWHRPWTAQVPKNLVSGRGYRGINVFLLASNGYGSPYWLTYKQATERGGHVRKGEHGTKIVFWKIGTRETEDADGDTIRSEERRVGKECRSRW